MRLKRPTSSTIFKFIAYDDSSISVPDEELKDKYQEYLKTAKLSVLNIDKNAKPSFYWLRPLNDHLWQSVRTLFNANQDPDAIDNTAAESIKALHEQVVDYCLLGADFHPEVIGVGDDGSLEVIEHKWAMGTENEKVKALIMQEEALTHAMFQFIIAVSVLSESEKKV